MTGPPDDLASWPELLEYAPCGLLVTEPDGTIRLVNATFCTWTGYRAAELVHEHRIQDLFTVGGRLFHHTHWLPLMQMQGSAAEVKFDVLHREGQRVPMLFNAIARQRGTRIYHELAVVVVHDRQKYEQELLRARKSAESALAEQQKAQQALARSRDELAQADRRKDEFLATLGHELRNPLSSMHNVLAILRRQSPGTPEMDRLHGMLGRQVHYLSRLVSDLLDVSRIAQGKLQLRRQPTELASVVRDAVELVQSSIDSTTQRLDISLPPKPVVVDADPVRLTQVLLNLLHNASKYTPHGGQITLGVICDDDYAVIRVRDSGVGIAREDLGSVFEMFSQVSGSAGHSQGGLGIGLALVRGLVDLHDGIIEACSEGPGKGSEFVVRLPVLRAKPEEEAIPPASAAQSPGGRCRVVVIDDNQDAAESLAMLLELEGHEVRVAGSGLAGLELARNSDAEVVLLDIGLPDIDGYEVARRIRQQPWGKKLLLIAVSGWGQERDRQAAADAGFDRHLTKPVDIGELTALLRAAG
ncbi:hybrid sensor histidine kinase/response regulator [Paraburkholderia caledonica]|uniref:hybrid sensor histidine kinase/response regulator n=1 Tax=Paraburkholderia caledonica TaxID=134536 RepID=UPI000DEEEE5D|nr:ATP-binding protein [Paraburkholderia caledonica]AXF18932.1 hybrid sensor histidine kinase/response regulator [Paraburkholderia caledonica]